MSADQPLQNRVDPFGDITSDSARGLFMGNRGGRIHVPETRTLSNRRWASKRWICCVTSFRNRHREVMGSGYTELFFLDEVTALAAGHRPCFECRRAAARDFAAAFAKGHGQRDPASADEMDVTLHDARRLGRSTTRPVMATGDLPDGTMCRIADIAYGILGDRALVWSYGGYRSQVPRASLPAEMEILTPHPILAALRSGFRPEWHPSAATDQPC